MATRDERVVLTLDDRFSSGMARAAAATALFRRELDRLDGSRLDEINENIRRIKDEPLRRASRGIDQFSGRLRLLTDAAVTLGPTALRLGASTIPVLTGSITGLGAAITGVGVAALTFGGMGDAFEAVAKADLEPTAENLQAMRVELEKLGPAGEDFVRYVSDLQPRLERLQMIARSGMLPGVEDGIDAMLQRLPLLQQVVKRVSLEMGNLARDAGQSLSSGQWTPFFEYIRSEAAPIMDDFARASGNVVLGLANMLVAFAPASNDFTNGLVRMSEAFADWSAGLDDNEPFQNFLAYVRESGPKVLDLLGSMVDMFVGLARAAAPWGDVALTAMTALADVLATIADSPIGPALFTAAAAMLAFNRAATIASTSMAKLEASWAGMSRGRMAAGVVGGIGLLATSLTDLDDKVGLANTSMLSFSGLMAGGGVGLAVGATAGLIMDLAAANDDLTEATERANEAMGSGDTDQMREQLEKLNSEIRETEKSASLSQGALRGLGFSGAWDKLGSIYSNLSGETDKAREAAARLSGELGSSIHEIGLFGTGLFSAADGAERLSGALEELTGWLDKRAAIRDYRDAIAEFSKGLKDSFGRDDIENLDAIGNSIAQVAESIKDPALKQQFLNGALAQLDKLADNAGPKAEAQIRRLMAVLKDLGLAKFEPPKLTIDSSDAEKKAARTKLALRELHTMQPRPHIGADDREAQQKGSAVKRLMRELSATKAEPKATLDTSQVRAGIAWITNALHHIPDEHVNVIVNRIGGGSVTSGYGGHSADPLGPADGITVPGQRWPYYDKVPAILAPGEEVISNRYGQADRHRDLLKAINANRLAGGGTAGHVFGPAAGPAPLNGIPATSQLYGLGEAFLSVNELAKRLSSLSVNQLKRLGDDLDHLSKKQLATLGKALDMAVESIKKDVDKAKASLDDVNSAMSSLADSIKSKFDVDLGGGTFNADAMREFGFSETEIMAAQQQAVSSQIQNMTAQAAALPGIIAQLKKWGLQGPALMEVINEMGVDQLRALVAQGPGAVHTLAAGLGGLYGAAGAAGQSAGVAVYGQEQKAATRELRGLRAELKELRAQQKQQEKSHGKKLDDIAEAAGVKGPNRIVTGLDRLTAQAGRRAKA